MQTRAIRLSCAPDAVAHRLIFCLLAGAAVEEGVCIAWRQAQHLAPLPRRHPRQV